MRARYALTIALAGAAAIMPTAANATDIYPGDYTSLPPGTNLGLVYVGHSSAGDLNIDGIGKVPKSKFDLNLAILRYLRHEAIDGVPVAFQAFLPIADFSNARIGGVGSPTRGGVGDLTVGFTVFPVNTVAKPGGTTVGLTAYVAVPIGRYDPNRVFNIGRGTWVFTPQLGIVQNLGKGLFIDGSADVALVPSRTKGGVRFKDRASTQLQAYLRYQLSPATSISGGYSGLYGGRRFAGGADLGLRTKGHGARVFVGHSFNPTTQLMVMAGTDLSGGEGGFRNRFTGQLRLLKAF